MRPLEILMALLVALCFLRQVLWLGRRPRWVDFLPLVAFVVVALQVAVEGYRWQMAPLYVLAAALILASLPGLRRQSVAAARQRWVTIAGAGLGLLLTLVAVAPPVLFPIPRVPKPSGAYPVGTFSLALTDAARKEIYSGNPDDPRRLMVQVWYPADPPPGAVTAPWVDRPDIIAPALAGALKLPVFFLDHLKYARTDAYLDAPLAAARPTYPVLLFSHGWTGFRAQNTYQAQELASHGYIVVGLEHPYGAQITVFPDGQIAPNNPQALPTGAPEAVYDAAARRLVDQWAGDLKFVLDTLTQMNADDREHGLTGRLDLGRVGVFGHSTGGGATVEFCARDTRCKAGLGMDAWLTPVAEATLASGVAQPFLFMYSEKWPTAKNWRLFDQLYSHSSGPDYLVKIAGTAHYDFTDVPLLTPIAAQIGLKGPLNGPRTVRIIADYTLAFFGQYLSGEPTALLGGNLPTYPEVTFSQRP